MINFVSKLIVFIQFLMINQAYSQYNKWLKEFYGKEQIKLEKALVGGRFLDAFKIADRLIEEDSAIAQYYFKRGLALDYLGYPDEAIVDYKKTLELNEQYFDAYFNLGYIYLTEAQMLEENNADILLVRKKLFEAQIYFEHFIKWINDKKASEKLLLVYNKLNISENRLDSITGFCHKQIKFSSDTISQFPVFSRGDSIFYDYLQDNFNVPARVYFDLDIGKSKVEFIIDTTGNVICPRITKSLNGEVDMELLRVINSLPHFEPAKNKKGEKIPCIVELPFKIRF